jgi:nucleotide-binding universal stress UspA family protein
MIEIRHILCPVDFSDFSRRALDHAVAVAKWYQSTVTVLHVCTITPVAVYAPGSGMPPYAALTPEDRETLMASMKLFAETEAGRAFPSSSRWQRDTASEILTRRGELWGKQQATIERHRADHVLHYFKELVREIERA